MSIPKTLLPRLAKALRERVDDASFATVAEAARALEPVLSRVAEANPSRFNKLTMKGAVALGGLTAADRAGRLERFKSEPSIGIVFADVVDFTGYTARNGDEAALDLLGDLRKLVERAARSGKGEVIKHMGDGFLLIFPSASQAIRASLALNDSLDRLHSDRDLIKMRIVAHEGSPTITEDDIFGNDVNIAAHLMDNCRPGSVLVSDRAKDHAERRLKKVTFDRRRKVKVQGVADKIEVWRAEGPALETSTK